MYRRRLLTAGASLGVATLAGCTAVGSGGDSTTSTATTVICESPEPRRIELAGTKSVSSEFAVSLDATMERKRATAEAPARVRVRLTNEGDKRETDIVDDGRCHLFNRNQGRSDPEGLWLHRAQDAPTDRANGCWTHEESPTNTRTFLAYGCGLRPLEPEEAVSTTYEVWDDYVTGGYYLPATYRFTARIRLTDPESDDDETDRHFDWWLDLRVAESDG